MEKDSVVIDTNLWISFLLTRDFTKLDRLLSTNQINLLVSQELLEEIVEVAECIFRFKVSHHSAQGEPASKGMMSQLLYEPGIFRFRAK